MPLENSRKEESRLHHFNASLLRGSAIGAAIGALIAGAAPAQAANECGALAATVTCTATGNNYPSGISYAAAADVTLTTNADVAATNTVRVTGTGVTTINNGGSVTTALNDQPGIVASGTSATVNSMGNVSTAGTRGTVSNGDGVTVTGTTGTANATVKNVAVTGPLSTGAGAVRPRAVVVTGVTAASATINGNVSSTNGDAVVVSATGATATATANVVAGASVTGGINGVVMTGPASATLSNAGTIRGGVTGAAVSITSGSLAVPGSGASTITNSGTIGNGNNLAILVNRGRATITNTGTINGSIRTAFENDVVNNAGVFNAFRNSDFGDGTDIFNNSGTLNVLPAGSVPSAVVFTELEAFNNSGTINLGNGVAGNTLTLPGTFTGSGTSTVVVDVALGAAPASDRLVVNGAATGSTAIVLNSVTPSVAGANAGLIVATGGAGSSAAAFTVAAPSQNIGFINYTISPTTAAGTTSYLLVGTPGDSVVRALKINEGAQNLWHDSADAFAAHMADLRTALWAGRDAERPQGAIWMVAQGGVKTRHDSKTSTAFGLSRVVDTSYQQDTFGFQLGADFEASPGLVIGSTAGFAGSALKSLNSADHTNFEDFNVGLYASFVSDNFFGNVLAKYDRVWVDSRSPVASFSASYDGKSYGLQGEAGVRFGSDNFFVEPTLTAAFVRTDLDSPVVTNAVLDFDELDGVRGKAGVRIGSVVTLNGSNRAVVYLVGNAVHEFEGRDGLSFQSNGTIFKYTNNRIGTYAEGKIGVDIASEGVLSGFIEAFGNVGDDYTAGGARAGLRLKI